MSNNQGDAATPAREREPEQTQTADIIENTQGAQSATSQPATSSAAENVGQSQAEPQRATDVQNEAEGSLAFTAQQSSNPQAAQTAATAMPQPTGDQSEGVANSAEITGGTNAQTDNDTQTQAKPDVSDQDWRELVPKLMAAFNNNREQLARAIGLHRSTVDRWLNGKSRPNTSTILRMRRLMQERRIE
jgi:DNA-binding XRE family transcriptional regulator